MRCVVSMPCCILLLVMMWRLVWCWKRIFFCVSSGENRRCCWLFIFICFLNIIMQLKKLDEKQNNALMNILWFFHFQDLIRRKFLNLNSTEFCKNFLISLQYLPNYHFPLFIAKTHHVPHNSTCPKNFQHYFWHILIKRSYKLNRARDS